MCRYTCDGTSYFRSTGNCIMSGHRGRLLSPHVKVLHFLCRNSLTFVNTTFQSQISLAIFHQSQSSLQRWKPQTFVSHTTKIFYQPKVLRSHYPLSSATCSLTVKSHSKSWMTSGENKSCHLIGYFCITQTFEKFLVQSPLKVANHMTVSSVFWDICCKCCLWLCLT